MGDKLVCFFGSEGQMGSRLSVERAMESVMNMEWVKVAGIKQRDNTAETVDKEWLVVTVNLW